MPGIGVISNPRARLNRLSPRIRERLAFIVGRGGEVASTWSLDDAASAAEAFRDNGIDMVAISGGDGTAHRTLELLLQVYGDDPLPPILLLPSGTQNMIPRSFGVGSSSLFTMLLALARYRHNLPMRCIRRNVLRVNDHHSFLFGLGITPRYLSMYYERGDTTPLGAAKLVGEIVKGHVLGSGELARALVEPLPLRYRLDDGPEQQGTLHTVFCSFVEEISLGFRIFPRAGWDPNVFEVLLASSDPTSVISRLHQLWVGSLRPIPDMERVRARSFELTLERPEPWVLDGEIYPPESHFVIRPGPELRFVVPGFSFWRRNRQVRWDQCGPWGMRFFV